MAISERDLGIAQEVSMVQQPGAAIRAPRVWPRVDPVGKLYSMRMDSVLPTRRIIQARKFIG